MQGGEGGKLCCVLQLELWLFTGRGRGREMVLCAAFRVKVCYMQVGM